MKPLKTVFGLLRQLKGFPPKYCAKRLFCFLQLPNDSRYVTGPAWGDKSRNTVHRYTPVQNTTSVNVATGKSQVHGGNKACG